ncbi:hypothetical protein C8Q70DRAFT_627273 [Cubamyces menziesii]|nr:hypothetical protein C8Q70DRAFT_627273 [Cubamyces menziesii]
MSGTVYFVALLIMNVLHLTLTLTSIVDIRSPVSQVTILTDPLTAILICRFLLALQSANVMALEGRDSSDSQADADRDHGNTSLRFASGIMHSMRGTVVVRSEGSMSDDGEFELDGEFCNIVSPSAECDDTPANAA